MRLLRMMAHRIRSLTRRSRVDADLQQEFELHINQLTREYVTAGFSEQDARLAAHRQFGAVGVISETCRDMRRVNVMQDFARDLLYATRLLRKSPRFTLTAVLTLALGIGANTAVFSVIYSVLLRPLPFKDPDRLVLVSEYSPGNVAKTGSPLLRYQARAAQNTVFEETAAYWSVSGGNGLVFGLGGAAERLQFSVVTNGFFSILGVEVMAGRTFAPSEALPGGAKVFIASYATWQQLLGGDPGAIGKTFHLDGEPYILIGILPPHFDFPGASAIWMPVGTLGTGPFQDRVSHQFWMLGRLRPRASLADAQSEMDGIQRRLARAYAATDANWRVNVRPLMDDFVANVRTSMWIIFGAVGFVLLIACTNVINLLLARGAAREREFAIRTAIGASRTRIVRQLLTETLLIAAAGAMLALMLARIGLDTLLRLSNGSIPRFEQPELSVAVLSFCGGLALLTTLIVGVVPGLRASEMIGSESLRAGQRTGSETHSSSRVRNVLVISEIALTVLLLSGAGLMLRSFQRLRAVDPGWVPDHIISVRIALPDALYPKLEMRAAFLNRLLENLNSMPGIQMAAATDRLPLSGENNWSRINIVGRPLLDSAHAPAVEERQVSVKYFRVLGIPLLRGREFTGDDVAGRRHVTVINEAMAKRFWPGSDPIGQRIVNVYHSDDVNEIIGVVRNIKDSSLDAQSPVEVYSPYGWWNTMTLVLRGNVDPAALVFLVRTAVARLDKEVPVYDMMPLRDVVNRSIGRQRFELVLLAAFAGIALLLAAVGVYGLLAFAVTRRTNEIGLRIALGAHPRDVQAMLISQGMRLITIGLAIGIIASLGLTRFMSGLLYQISPGDPVTLAAGSAILAGIGALACWIPARRVLSVDPTIALRCE